MLIDILVKSRKGGYLAKEMPGSLSFFSNNTLSMRREILKDIGRYDDACQRSEDVEICARIARSNWMMFLSTDMVFYHRPRSSVRALISQWWGYGKYIPYVFHKHNKGQWEIFYLRGSSISQPLAPGLRYRKLLYLEGMPFTICVFITPFLLFHIFLLAILLSTICGITWLALAFVVLSALSFIIYAREDFTAKRSIAQVLKLLVIRYLVNIAFVSSHLLYGFRYGTLYLAPVIGERQKEQSKTHS